MAVVTEEIITLDLVTTLVRCIGVNKSGKLQLFAYCKMISDMLKYDRIKTSQFAN